MSIQIGTLLIEMSANVGRLQTDMERATKVVDKGAHEIHKSWETVKTAFEAVVGFEFAKKVIEESIQSEQAANRLTVAYRLQGEQVGFTRHQLDELADSMAEATQFKDNDLKRGEAELLKFGNIYGDVFTRAMKLSADLAAFNGTDFVSAIDAVGKALANPTQGVKGLGAAIGKLLPEQAEHIKSLVEQNKGLEAQNYILDIAQKKIGGTSDLMNTGYTKAVADATKAWDKFLEAMGQLILIKGTVTGVLDEIAAAMRGVASAFQGGSFAEGVLGKQTAMAKEITDLQTEIKSLEGLKIMITDEMGNVIGEDPGKVEALKNQLKDLEAEYKKLYQTQAEGGNKPGKPKFGLEPEQRAFLKALDKQTESVGQGPIGGLFAKADELHLGEKTRLMIQKLGLAIQEDADQADRAKDSMAGWQKAFTFSEGQHQALSDLQLQTRNLTLYREEADLATASQKIDNEIRKVSVTLVGEQKDAFLDQARVLKGEYMTAFRENQDEQRRWTTGFQQSMNNVLDYSTNAAAQINGLFTNAFKGMEDALVAFTKTGKLDFKSLADSIITDLIRIRIQQSVIAPLSSALSGSAGTSAVSSLVNLFGIGYGQGGSVGAMSYGPSSSGGVAGRASGGPIDAGTPYWVGEQGPELVVPRANGTVIPNGQAGGSTINVNPTIHIDSRTDQAQVMGLVQRGIAESVAQVEQSFSRGGRLAKLVGTSKG